MDDRLFTYVVELNKAEITKVSDNQVSGIDRDDELTQLHRLGP